MSRPTRDERFRRQEFDDGAPSDVVWYVPSRPHAADSLRVTKPRGASYHDDPSCHAIVRSGTEDPAETTRQEAQDEWLTPCTKCVLDGVPPKDGDDETDGDTPRFRASDYRGLEADKEPEWP